MLRLTCDRCFCLVCWFGFYFYLFGLASNLENPVSKMLSYLVIAHTGTYLDVCMLVVVLRLILVTAHMHGGWYCHLLLAIGLNSSEIKEAEIT